MLHLLHSFTKLIKDINMLHKSVKIKSEEKQSQIYPAPNPYSYSLLDGIAKGLTYIPNLIFGNISGKSILPAQFAKSVGPDQQLIKNLEMKYHVEMKPYQIKTHDDAYLSSIEINCPSEEKNHPYIIEFNGNGESYTREYKLTNLANDASRLQATVIGFNYRGVEPSTSVPTSKTQLVTDGIAQVQRLLDKKVEPNRIVLYGLSLGGGIATLVAKHFHDKGIRINLFNDRSFSSISSTATRMIFRELPEAAETAIESTSYSSLSASDWEINAAKAYKTIPSQYKGYMYVADAAELKGNGGDGIIPHKSSLHEGVKDSKDQGKHCYKMFTRNSLFGHNLQRNQLIYSKDDKLTGQDIFEEFVRSVTPRRT